MHAGGEILASGGIREAYEHGKGGIIVRGLAFIEGTDAVASISAAEAAPKRAKKGVREKAVKPSIVITELPYQTNKADFVAKVAALVEDQKLTGAHPPLPKSGESCQCAHKFSLTFWGCTLESIARHRHDTLMHMWCCMQAFQM